MPKVLIKRLPADWPEDFRCLEGLVVDALLADKNTKFPTPPADGSPVSIRVVVFKGPPDCTQAWVFRDEDIVQALKAASLDDIAKRFGERFAGIKMPPTALAFPIGDPSYEMEEVTEQAA